MSNRRSNVRALRSASLAVSKRCCSAVCCSEPFKNLRKRYSITSTRYIFPGQLLFHKQFYVSNMIIDVYVSLSIVFVFRH